jgi:hypothetical protein
MNPGDYGQDEVQSSNFSLYFCEQSRAKIFHLPEAPHFRQGTRAMLCGQAQAKA